MGDNNSFYKSSGPAYGGRTFVPGMKLRQDVTEDAPQGNAVERRASAVKYQDRRIMGMLFSRSADSRGEIYPVYQGRNTIGNNPGCDIYLAEATVSQGHAVLLVRCIPTSEGGEKTTVTLTDYDSEYGTYVNGQRIGYDKVSLNGGEVIGIGSGYTLIYVSMIGTELGEEMVDFKPLPREDNKPDEKIYGVMFTEPQQPQRSIDTKVYPNAVGEQEENLFYGRTKKKSEDHSGAKTIN